MPSYDYKCQKCSVKFTIERSMTDDSSTSCTECGSENVSRIWNMFIRSSGVTADVGQGQSPKKSKSGGCGSCCSNSCGSCC